MGVADGRVLSVLEGGYKLDEVCFHSLLSIFSMKATLTFDATRSASEKPLQQLPRLCLVTTWMTSSKYNSNTISKNVFFLATSTNSLSSLSCFSFSTTPSKAVLEAVMNTASAHKEGWECMKELVKSFPTQWEISQNEPNSALPRQWSAPLKYP